MKVKSVMKGLVGATLVSASLSGAAFAADLPVYVPTTVIQPELFSWTGCYVGVNINYDWADVDAVSPFGLSDYSTNPSGPGVGGQIGCDYQFEDSPFVIGVVVDGSWQHKTGTTSIPNTTPAQSITTEIPLLASLRGRAGVAVDTTLIYATGGLAVANIRHNVAVGANNLTASGTQWGWTAGLGVETHVTENITIFAEYAYTDLGTQNYTFAGANFGGGNDTIGFNTVDHQIKLGLNWRF
jgi:outer membrane immunogenic protein